MFRDKITNILGLGILLALLIPAAVFAGQSSSTNFQVDQVNIGGSGSVLHACSTSYCARQSLGEITSGNSSSTNYQAQAGFNTSTPYLEFLVTNSNTDLGGLSTGSTSTTTGSFSVKTYLASGYVVINASTGPKNSSFTMASPSSPTASAAGTEQFGINLVSNTGCTGIAGTLGSNPVQVPSGSFSFGAAASGYNTACQFKYVNGDTVASSSQSSGETDYTISYIENISATTPGGIYTFNHVLVATSTF